MTAVHRAIADDLRDAIRSGRYAPGAPLPSARTLGDQYGVTHQTAATALRHLAAERWVVLHPGRVALVADTHPPEPTPASPTPSLAELARRVEVLEELHSSDTPGHQHP